jgi:hypothetical protein
MAFQPLAIDRAVTMTNPNSLIQVGRVYICGAQAKDGPRGVLIEVFPLDGALEAAGLPEGARLPPLRFVLPESLARQLADAIPRHLAGVNHDMKGETIN